MPTPMTRDQLIETVRACVADSLARKLEEVTPASRLFADLGADSLDFIDILFLLEKKCGVKLRETEFDFLARMDFSSPEVMRDGHLTAATVEKLMAWLPELAAVPDRAQVTPRQLFGFITIETMCRVLERKMRAG